MAGLALAPDARSAEPVLRLSRSTASINDELRVTGPGLGALRQTHRLLVGSQEVTNKALVSWDGDEVRLLVRAQPGTHQVQLVPRAGGPAVSAGSISIAKHRLPRAGEAGVAGAVHLRLRPGASPEGLAIGLDRLEPIFPDAAPGSVLTRWHRAVVPPGQESDRILDYAADPAVELAEPAGRVPEAAQAPNDRAYREPTYGQHPLRRIRLPAVWEIRSEGAPIAILDSGIDGSHEDLRGRVTVQHDFTGSGTLNACGSHGTSVAGLAAAITHNQVGLAGAVPNTTLGSFKVLSGGTGLEYPCHQMTDYTSATSLSLGIEAARAHGFKVANLSIQCMGCFKQLEQDAITAAWQSGMFLAAAAGNLATDAQNYPAAYEHVFAVANSDIHDERFHTSNWGTWVDIAAPGASLWIPTNGSNYQYHQGATSWATPMVTAAASLLSAEGYSNSEIAARLNAGADPLPTSWSATPINGGRLNVWRAFMAEGIGCIRDIPAGSFLSFPDGSTWNVTAFGQLRPVVDPSVLASWQASDEVIPTCETRRADFGVSTTPWGYRPGSLVADPADGRLWLITTNGADHGGMVRRLVPSASVQACYGWSSSNIIAGNTTALSAHPVGPDVDGCPPLGLPRRLPDGTLARGVDGQVWMVEAGHKRSVSPVVFGTWFGTGEGVAATPAELDLLPTGAPWGFRPGTVVRHASGDTSVVASDGLRLASGWIRPVSRYTPPGRVLADRLPMRERGMAMLPIVDDGPGGSDAHLAGGALLDADEQPWGSR